MLTVEACECFNDVEVSYGEKNPQKLLYQYKQKRKNAANTRNQMNGSGKVLLLFH